ncbi:MAG: choice-of-anchor B family protein [Bacteroidetes bacterium]|nr:choice-of-anchor B family protein [Bacteroidota bacterium]MBL0016665.1 choice-of-anchor B family protein [Bacteroidota bacterium]MBP6721727.1 choice-of-anchor B family protein [Bacteroidia bacterium]
MRKYLMMLAALLLVTGTIWGQASKNMSLIGHLTFPDDLADVVGYKAGNTEYAFVGHESGVGIVSLANPANPVLLQDLPGINTIWRELDVYQNYLYIVNEGGDGLRIVNLANLPGTVTYKDTVINGMETGHTLMVDGTRLYVYGADIDNGGVSIFSLANPWKPTHIGQFTTRYVHDAYVRNGVAYLGEINDGFMEIVNLTNASNPVSLGSVTTPSNFTHNTWLNAAGDVCFTTDEVNAAFVAAYDITNPANIVEIDRVRSSLSAGQAIPHNVKVLNEYLVTAYYKDGVQVVDASRPHNLIETGYYDTNPQSGGGFDGVWGSDPYLPSGLVLASDMSEGLFVLGSTYTRGCYLEGQVTDFATGFPINGASITIQSTSIVDASNATGDYATGVADAGTYSVTYSKFGYQDSTISVALTNGVLVTANIPLRPLNRVSVTVNVIELGTGNPIPNAKVVFNEISGASQTPYTANGSGQVVDPNFIAGNYNVIGGKWGWVTRQVVVNATQSVNTITIELPKGYYDDFALDFGWATQSNANSGDWVREEPVGTFGFGNQEFNPEEDINGDISDLCFVTGNGGGQIGDDDVDAGEVTLISPTMDLTTYNTPVLRYHRWFANGGGNGNPNDSLIVEISNGQSTVVLKRVFGLFSNFWQQDSFVVSNYITLTANMEVRFIAGDYPQGNVVEGGVDGFDVVDRGAVAVNSPFDSNVLLSVFPNPMTAQSMVRFELAQTEVATAFELRDVLGKLVFTKELNQAAGQFEMPIDLPTGAYFGSLLSNGQVVKTTKVLK